MNALTAIRRDLDRPTPTGLAAAIVEVTRETVAEYTDAMWVDDRAFIALLMATRTVANRSRSDKNGEIGKILDALIIGHAGMNDNYDDDGDIALADAREQLETATAELSDYWSIWAEER